MAKYKCLRRLEERLEIFGGFGTCNFKLQWPEIGKNLTLHSIILDEASRISRTHKPVRVGESYDNTNFFRLFCVLISFAAQPTTSGMLDTQSDFYFYFFSPLNTRLSKVNYRLSSNIPSAYDVLERLLLEL